jgi:hypothetical protein
MRRGAVHIEVGGLTMDVYVRAAVEADSYGIAALAIYHGVEV